ncbi:hypothetical protein [Tsukamurella paurometabola]|nr:hypothetical protein [Tsukamurella paurometabola]
MSGSRRRARGPVIAIVAAAALLGLMAVRPFGPIPLLLLGGVAAVAIIIGVSGGGNPTAGTADPVQPRRAPRPTARPSAPAAAPAPTARERWERARARHDEVLSEYGAYELDPEMLLRFPAMWDLGAAKVMAFHDALDHAGSLRTDDIPDEARADAYAKAVTDLRITWIAADRYARSTGRDNLAAEDVRDLDRGLKLYRHAQAAESAERAAYLEQVVATMDRLVDRGVLTRTPVIRAELEGRARRAIEG